MFPKSYRLNLRQEREFFHKAKRKSFRVFQIFVVDQENLEAPQFAVIVPKKVSKKSVVRHKLLRQMRSILMTHQEVSPKAQVVVVLFYSALRLSFEQLSEEANKALRSF